MKRMPILGLLAMSALLAAVPLIAQNSSTLKDMSFTQDGGKTVILLQVDGPFTYETASLTMPRRLVIDLTPVDKIAAPPFLQVNNSGVVSVRTGQFKPQTVRVVFDLNDQNSAQTIAVAADGLRITFWLEGEAAAIKEPIRTQTVREIPQEEVKKVIGEPSGGQDRTNFFVRASAGLTLFLKPDLTVNSTFPLFGETATLDETYSLKTGLALDVSFGKYFSLGSSRMKAGIGFSYWKLPNEGTFNWSIPDLFEMNSPHAVTLNETTALKTQMFSFYAYALFSFVDTDNFSLFFGPLAGMTLGKYLTLSDWDLNYSSSSATPEITNPIYFEDTVSEFLFGAALDLEWKLGKSIALVLDTKMLYINPKIANLGIRANLLQVQPTLGVQFSF